MDFFGRPSIIKQSTFLVCAIAITAICALVRVLTGEATASYPPGATGYDVSFPQCAGSLPSGGAFGIVGVTNGLPWSANPCLSAEYAWAASQPSPPSYYTNTANPGPISTHWNLPGPRPCTDPNSNTDTGCSYNYGWNAAIQALAVAQNATSNTASGRPWWLDVETVNSWNGSPAANAATVQGYLDELAVAGVPSMGIYSAPAQWSTITGGYQLIGPNWIAGAPNAQSAPSYCSSTISGGPVELVQYPLNGFNADFVCGSPATPTPSPTASATATPTNTSPGSSTPTRSPTVTSTATFVASPTSTPTLDPALDADGDGVANGSDNCPFDANAGQENTTKSIDNGAGVVADDVTVANSHLTGDACSLDADGDGLPDAKELSATGCGAFDLSTTTHPNPAKNDITNDDNHNGNAAPPMGTDGADNGPSSDTDNDGILDGAECILGTNPRSAASKPTATQCANLAQPTPGVGPNTTTTDADSDGLPAAWEYCKWGTSDTKTDTDGDAKGDCKEAADVDGNGVVNFAGDTLAVAKASQGVIGKTQDFDLNGDGLVNFAGDALSSAKLAQAVIPCL